MAPPSSSAQRVLGRYVLYGEVAAGGMATVHFGRLLGVVGFSRTVAIKRLHPQFAKDPEFVAMFLDEARLAARIRHPNVVSTLDVVATEGEVFLVMEYVQGVPLSHLIAEATGHGTPIPARIVASIVANTLHGLHAAHEATSERGEPLRLVHRDVSPQNVLVGVDGVARVLDFGVAKAIGRMQTTRDGQVKGKLAYMAPEHVTGREVSRASDVFSASVVLWEALTGQRLFGGGDDGQVIYRILSGPIDPPSRHVPGLPAAVDEVTMRGLERDLGKRFATAKEMARALEESLPPASASEVGDYVDRAASALLGTRARELAAIESGAGADPPAGEVGDETGPASEVLQDTKKEWGRKRRSWMLVTAVALGVAAVGGVTLRGVRRGGVVAAAPSATSAELPTPTTSASADADAPQASAVIDAPPASTGVPAHHAARPPAHNPATTKCDPPFTIDSSGYRHYKRECIR